MDIKALRMMVMQDQQARSAKKVIDLLNLIIDNYYVLKAEVMVNKFNIIDSAAACNDAF